MIIGVEKFKGKPKKWKQLKATLKLEVKFRYPSIELKAHRPKDRLALSKKILKGHYQTLKSNYNKCQPLGKKEVYGAILSVPYKELHALQKNEAIEWINILKIEGFKRRKKKKTATYFSVVLQVVIEVEGVKKTKLLNEIKIVLVKAKSIEQAKKKVKKGEATSAPYLNPAGKIVHWKFKKIIDCYETTMENPNAVNDTFGIEVYAIFIKNNKSLQKVIKAMKE
ncbi:MAG: DUF4288 domain-containing protein [Aureispira sp.]